MIRLAVANALASGMLPGSCGARRLALSRSRSFVSSRDIWRHDVRRRRRLRENYCAARPERWIPRFGQRADQRHPVRTAQCQGDGEYRRRRDSQAGWIRQGKRPSSSMRRQPRQQRVVHDIQSGPRTVQLSPIPAPTGAGTGLLMRRGYTIVWSGGKMRRYRIGSQRLAASLPSPATRMQLDRRGKSLPSRFSDNANDTD